MDYYDYLFGICHLAEDNEDNDKQLVTTRPIPYLHQTSLRRSILELLSNTGIIYYTFSLVIDNKCAPYKMP